MTTYRVKVDFDTETDRLAVWKDGIGWVEVVTADFVQQMAREVIYGPIPHDIGLCGWKDGKWADPCTCWCQACEMHNARAKA